MSDFTDKDRIDWLEREANEPGGLLLHDGSESGRRGLGLRPGHVVRTLREAIDHALRYERDIEPHRTMIQVIHSRLPSVSPPLPSVSPKGE